MKSSLPADLWVFPDIAESNIIAWWSLAAMSGAWPFDGRLEPIDRAGREEKSREAVDANLSELQSSRVKIVESRRDESPPGILAVNVPDLGSFYVALKGSIKNAIALHRALHQIYSSSLVTWHSSVW